MHLYLLCLCMCVYLHLIAGDLICPDTEIMFAFSFSQPCWSVTKLALTAPVHQAGLVPPTTLCPMPPRYAPDASQLVCRLCSAGRLLETDARATVGPCLRICVIGQPWALTVTFTAGRDSERVGSVSSSELSSSAHWTSGSICTSLQHLLSPGQTGQTTLYCIIKDVLGVVLNLCF